MQVETGGCGDRGVTGKGSHATSDLHRLIESYDAGAPVDRASTIPSAWYTDPRIADLERRHVFGATWQYVGRIEQVAAAGQYITADIAGEPIVVVRGGDGVLRAFYNVCRHHAALILADAEGAAKNLHCPYHGWTYSLEGALRTTPEFDGVCEFDKASNGLVPVRVESWESLLFVCLSSDTPPLAEYLGDLAHHVAHQNIGRLRFTQRRSYELKCNWKVYVDNYLDGGYHVPFIHKGLGSVLSYKDYKIENGARFCRQSSPVTSSAGEAETAAVRGGDMAYYDWVYPNFMLNWYEGYMDINLVLPIDTDRCLVIFDFFFAATESAQIDKQALSIKVAERVQQEDIDICESVQRGLQSRTYDVGRLSVRREAGEHLFHRLLHADLIRSMQ